MDQIPIPAFYRIFFTVIDPLIALWGAYMDYFTPAVVIDAFLPSRTSPYSPLQQQFLLHQLGGALILCAFLDIFLLRRTKEVWIWKTQQWGQLVYDIAILYGMWVALGLQGRRSVSELRVEDWGSLAITGGCGLVRAAFVADIGLHGGKVKTRK